MIFAIMWFDAQMIHKPELEALRERALSAHMNMSQVCKRAGIWPQTWYRAYARGSMEYVTFRKLTDAMALIDG